MQKEESFEPILNKLIIQIQKINPGGVNLVTLQTLINLAAYQFLYESYVKRHFNQVPTPQDTKNFYTAAQILIQAVSLRLNIDDIIDVDRIRNIFNSIQNDKSQQYSAFWLNFVIAMKDTELLGLQNSIVRKMIYGVVLNLGQINPLQIDVGWRDFSQFIANNLKQDNSKIIRQIQQSIQQTVKQMSYLEGKTVYQLYPQNYIKLQKNKQLEILNQFLYTKLYQLIRQTNRKTQNQINQELKNIKQVLNKRKNQLAHKSSEKFALENKILSMIQYIVPKTPNDGQILLSIYRNLLYRRPLTEKQKDYIHRHLNSTQKQAFKEFQQKWRQRQSWQLSLLKQRIEGNMNLERYNTQQQRKKIMTQPKIDQANIYAYLQSRLNKTVEKDRRLWSNINNDYMIKKQEIKLKYQNKMQQQAMKIAPTQSRTLTITKQIENRNNEMRQLQQKILAAEELLRNKIIQTQNIQNQRQEVTAQNRNLIVSLQAQLNINQQQKRQIIQLKNRLQKQQALNLDQLNSKTNNSQLLAKMYNLSQIINQTQLKKIKAENTIKQLKSKLNQAQQRILGMSQKQHQLNQKIEQIKQQSKQRRDNILREEFWKQDVINMQKQVQNTKRNIILMEQKSEYQKNMILLRQKGLQQIKQYEKALLYQQYTNEVNKIKQEANIRINELNNQLNNIQYNNNRERQLQKQQNKAQINQYQANIQKLKKQMQKTQEEMKLNEKSMQNAIKQLQKQYNKKIDMINLQHQATRNQYITLKQTTQILKKDYENKMSKKQNSEIIRYNKIIEQLENKLQQNVKSKQKTEKQYKEYRQNILQKNQLHQQIQMVKIKEIEQQMSRVKIDMKQQIKKRNEYQSKYRQQHKKNLQLQKNKHAQISQARGQMRKLKKEHLKEKQKIKQLQAQQQKNRIKIVELSNQLKKQKEQRQIQLKNKQTQLEINLMKIQSQTKQQVMKLLDKTKNASQMKEIQQIQQKYQILLVKIKRANKSNLQHLLNMTVAKVNQKAQQGKEELMKVKKEMGKQIVKFIQQKKQIQQKYTDLEKRWALINKSDSQLQDKVKELQKKLAEMQKKQDKEMKQYRKEIDKEIEKQRKKMENQLKRQQQQIITQKQEEIEELKKKQQDYFTKIEQKRQEQQILKKKYEQQIRKTKQNKKLQLKQQLKKEKLKYNENLKKQIQLLKNKQEQERKQTDKKLLKQLKQNQKNQLHILEKKLQKAKNQHNQQLKRIRQQFDQQYQNKKRQIEKQREQNINRINKQTDKKIQVFEAQKFTLQKKLKEMQLKNKVNQQQMKNLRQKYQKELQTKDIKEVIDKKSKHIDSYKKTKQMIKQKDSNRQQIEQLLQQQHYWEIQENYRDENDIIEIRRSNAQKIIKINQDKDEQLYRQVNTLKNKRKQDQVFKLIKVAKNNVLKLKKIQQQIQDQQEIDKIIQKYDKEGKLDVLKLRAINQIQKRQNKIIKEILQSNLNPQTKRKKISKITKIDNQKKLQLRVPSWLQYKKNLAQVRRAQRIAEFIENIDEILGIQKYHQQQMLQKIKKMTRKQEVIKQMKQQLKNVEQWKIEEKQKLLNQFIQKNDEQMISEVMDNIFDRVLLNIWQNQPKQQMTQQYARNLVLMYNNNPFQRRGRYVNMKNHIDLVLQYIIENSELNPKQKQRILGYLENMYIYMIKDIKDKSIESNIVIKRYSQMLKKYLKSIKSLLNDREQENIEKILQNTEQIIINALKNNSSPLITSLKDIQHIKYPSNTMDLQKQKRDPLVIRNDIDVDIDVENMQNYGQIILPQQQLQNSIARLQGIAQQNNVQIINRIKQINRDEPQNQLIAHPRIIIQITVAPSQQMIQKRIRTKFQITLQEDDFQKIVQSIKNTLKKIMRLKGQDYSEFMQWRIVSIRYFLNEKTQDYLKKFIEKNSSTYDNRKKEIVKKLIKQLQEIITIESKTIENLFICQQYKNGFDNQHSCYWNVMNFLYKKQLTNQAPSQIGTLKRLKELIYNGSINVSIFNKQMIHQEISSKYCVILDGQRKSENGLQLNDHMYIIQNKQIFKNIVKHSPISYLSSLSSKRQLQQSDSFYLDIECFGDKELMTQKQANMHELYMIGIISPNNTYHCSCLNPKSPQNEIRYQKKQIIMNSLLFIQDIMKKSDKKIFKLWAYNGINYDYRFLLPLMIQRYEKITLLGRQDSPKGYIINIEGKQLRMLDTKTLITSGSLKANSEKYNKIYKKLDFEIGNINTIEEYKQKFISIKQYNRFDCLSMKQLVQNMYKTLQQYAQSLKKHRKNQFINTNEIKELFTIPSIAIKIFRWFYIDQKVIITPDEQQIQQLHRKNYYGGCTQVWKHFSQQQLYQLDINSQYPSIMHDYPLPIYYITRQTLDQIASLRQCQNIKKGLNQRNFYRINYFLLSKPYCCTIGISSKNKIYYPYTFTQSQSVQKWMWGLQIQEHIKNGSVFIFSQCIRYTQKISNRNQWQGLKNYVSDAFQRRKKAKQEKNQLMQNVSKLLNNSLYGKLAQRKMEKQYMMELQEGQQIDNEKNYKINKQSQSQKKKFFIGNFVRLASFITSGARSRLTKYIYQAGPERVWYMDTDSIYTNKQGYENLIKKGSIDNIRLGAIKLQRQIKAAFFIARKMYIAIIQEQNKFLLTLKSKGINRNQKQSNLKTLYQNCFRYYKLSLFYYYQKKSTNAIFPIMKLPTIIWKKTNQGKGGVKRFQLLKKANYIYQRDPLQNGDTQPLSMQQYIAIEKNKWTKTQLGDQIVPVSMQYQQLQIMRRIYDI